MKKKTQELHDESQFANFVCQLIIDKNKKSLAKSMPEVEVAYDHFIGNVRNIYQYVGNEIPLFRLFELVREKEDWGAGNYNYTNIEYLDAVGYAMDDCTKMYGSEITFMPELGIHKIDA